MALICNQTDTRGSWVVAVSLGVVALLLWLPALSTPFWGDDYVFLQGALASRISGESWWRPFWPDIRFQFWRPLGHETYWRFVEGILGADPWAAHLTNFILWLLGCLSVGLLGATLARALSWDRPVLSGALTAGVYAVSAIHFTPIHWTSSGDSLLIVLWSTLTLAAWAGSPLSRPSIRALLSGSIPILQILALFSKESAVLLPLLMLCLSAFAWERCKPGRPEIAAWVTCSVLILVWLALRERFILPPAPEYALVFEANVLRNAASLAAWCLNIPREALRMMILGPHVDGMLWALAAGLPMTAFIYLAGFSLVNRVSVRQAAAVALFVLVGYGPYFFLAWQSYEYYAQVAMIMPAVLLARGMMLSTRAYIAMVLFSLSSFIAIEGSRMVGYPGLIGRARWAEEQLSNIVTHDIVAQATRDVSTPLLVSVTNPHEFYAIGTAGLAWRLALSESDVVIVEGCNGEADGLLAFQTGKVSYVECATGETGDLDDVTRP
jgi:hypothetical protein